MSDWLKTQMDFIYVGYGLTFFFLAIAAWSLQRQRIGHVRWGWLAAFGLIHGANLWLEGLMYGFQWAPGSTLRLLLRLISFVCLLEFGRASLAASTRRFPDLWLHLPLLGLVLLYAGSGLNTLQAVVRYAVAFPAALLATFAIARHAAGYTGLDRRQLHLAAFLMAVYGVLIGLVPARAPWSPASFLNESILCELLVLPTQVWRALLVLLVAILLWWHYRRSQEKLLHQPGQLVWWYYMRCVLPVTMALLAAGWLLTEQVGLWAEQRMRADVLWRARMMAAALDPEHLGKLTGTRADLNNPNYQVIKAQLMSLRNMDERARFYYLAGLNSSLNVFFFADSEPPGSRFMSQPGDIYRDASKTFRAVLRTGAPATEGPVADPWGIWVSGLARVQNAPGLPPMLAGIDIRADDWAQIIAGQRMWPILSMMLILAMLSGAFIVVQRLQMLADWLTNSEQRYRSLIESNASAMLLMNPDSGLVEEANPAAARFYGYPQSQMSGMPVRKFSLLSETQLAELLQKAGRGGLTYRSRHRLSDGSERDVEVALSPLALREGQRRYFGIVRDITQQAQAERALQDNEARLRKIYDSMSEFMLIGEPVYDAAGQVVNCAIVDCNASFLRFLGKPREEVVGQLMTGVFGYFPPFLQQGAEVVASGLPQHCETYLEPMGVYLELSMFLPEPKRFAMFASDITAQKYGEEQARVQSIALSAAANGIVIMDRTGKIIWTNPAFTAMTGYALGEIQGRTLELLRSNKHPPEFYADLTEAFRIGRIWSGEIINRRKDGQFYTEAMTVTPVCDSRGVVTHFIEIKQDITEQRALQQQFLQAQKMESVGRLAAGIAHDFNNQLQGILGFSDLLRRSFTGDDQRLGDVEQIRKAAYAAANLTRQLMAFGRRQALAIQVVDLNKLIEDGQPMHQKLVGEDIRFVLDLEPELHRVKADPSQLDQILMNLFVNARDAMAQGGRITISTYNTTLDARDVGQMNDVRPGHFVVLAVSDNGSGIPPEVLPQIFEPFFTTKEKNRGTGLGLATVYGIARQHNGWIHVYSQIGKGTTFKIYIPAMVSEESNLLAPTQAAIQAPIRGTGQRILLVEDEPGVRELALRILRENNYAVSAAASVTEGANLFASAEQPFDMVLSDVVLPDGNGLDLVEQLLSKQPGLRILMASGYTDERSRWPAIQSRGLRFLPKPYPVAMLLRTVQEVLAQPPLSITT